MSFPLQKCFSITDFCGFSWAFAAIATHTGYIQPFVRSVTKQMLTGMFNALVGLSYGAPLSPLFCDYLLGI